MNHIFLEVGNLKCSKNARPDSLVVGIPTVLMVGTETARTRFSVYS
jgi:hypothetical protein